MSADKEIKEEFDKKWRSKCHIDAKKHHGWERLGVVLDASGSLYLVWRCSQCKGVILEPLEGL